MYDPEEVRAALDLDPGVPTVLCDARESRSVRDVLITLVESIYASQGL
jgi:signal recognition particle receptor subunit beta